MRARSDPSIRLPPVRLATRSLGHARVLLGRKPALADELDALRKAAAGALSGALCADIQVTARLADAPTLPARALGHGVVFCALALEGPGAEAFLEVDLRLVAALAALRTGGAGPDGPVLAATRFERALLGELLLRVLAALREVGGPEARWRPRLVELGTARIEAERRLGAGPSLLVELAIDAPAIRGRAVLHLPELAGRSHQLFGVHAALLRAYAMMTLATGAPAQVFRAERRRRSADVRSRLATLPCSMTAPLPEVFSRWTGHSRDSLR